VNSTLGSRILHI